MDVAAALLWQIWVPGQTAPSLVIGPEGEVLAELPADEPAVARVELDLSRVSDRSLSERRADLGP